MTDNNSTNAAVTQTSQASHSAASNKKTKKPGSKRATAAIILALLVAGSVVAYEQYQYTQNQKTIGKLSAQVTQLQNNINQQLQDNKQQFQKDSQHLIHKVGTNSEQQQKSIKSLQLALADIKGRSPNDWLLAEADYLTKMAGRKLFLEHDIESATQLMQSADQRIAALNDPSLVSLRKSMAEDITQLKSLPIIDRDGLIINLISLQTEIDKLPLANSLLPKEEKKQDIAVSEDINDWQDNLLTSVKDFTGHFITFRTRDGNATPLLSPEQHFYFKENMKAKLEGAIKGVNVENNDIYQASLQAALDWSNKYFNQHSLKVQKFEQALRQLKEKNITVNYPVKLKSQKPLTDVISDRLRRSVTVVGKGDK
ncbi:MULTISPECIES: uroporphyrinogen-III C-methyltransferase [Vibrio]|uniref:Heme biosynthesis operon protein HemX n=1 Tax=Vibrio algicola TaxID=2662262 RepID=A0A5Q0TG86_9VIBR|nr:MULTISPECIES: uroporphyrinogen-III C-methyltransferase [Vibrio]MBD1577696.1 heme biosynthesis operon protein HemX [Vibrio sp. S11_S32]